MIADILSGYDTSEITIAVLGGHSALDICAGVKKYGFKTLVVCKKGREKVYADFYKTRKDAFGNQKACVDEVLVLDEFADIIKPEIQNILREKNAIFIHHRYFWVYCDFNEIENNFRVPIYGTRHLLRLEERDVPNNQYFLLNEAGIRIPKIFASPKEISGPVMVKVNEAVRTYERAFFVATSEADFHAKSKLMLAKGQITEEALNKAIIEEFVLGAQVNFNFFWSPLSEELELMGTDIRRQTSLDGFLRLNAEVQTDLLRGSYAPSMVETGHVAVTIKESLLEKVYDIGMKFVEISKKHAAPGIIGPFALQGAVSSEEGSEDLVIFDVSMRIPGSPGTRFTPYSGYLWGESLSYGERIGMELRLALEKNLLTKLLT